MRAYYETNNLQIRNLFYTRPLNDHEQEEFELDYLGEVGREKSTDNLH